MDAHTRRPKDQYDRQAAGLLVVGLIVLIVGASFAFPGPGVLVVAVMLGLAGRPAFKWIGDRLRARDHSGG